MYFNDRFSKTYQFRKPNDERALELMNCCARAVMKELPDVCVAYGVSDEYRFVALCFKFLRGLFGIAGGGGGLLAN